MSSLVSVIMCTYNGGSSIRNAVNSILNQTYRNIEIIICDDGSDDIQTKNIIERYKTHVNIKVFSNLKNQGIAFSLNECIKLAQGELLLRMDDDDISAYNRVERMVDFISRNHDVSFAGSFANLIGEKYKTTLSLPLIPQIKDIFNSRAFIHASLLIRRSAIQKVGLYTVSEATNRLEDYDLFCKLYEQGIVGKNIPEYLYDISEGASWNKRRTVSFRIREFKLRYYWFKRLKLSLVHLPILLKPLILAFLPQKIYNFIRSKNR